MINAGRLGVETARRTFLQLRFVECVAERKVKTARDESADAIIGMRMGFDDGIFRQLDIDYGASRTNFTRNPTDALNAPTSQRYSVSLEKSGRSS